MAVQLGAEHIGEMKGDVGGAHQESIGQCLALIVRLDSPGPALFIQKRVGKNDKEFPVFKFRSMIADAEARKRLLEASNKRNGPGFKMKNDPATRASFR